MPMTVNQTMKKFFGFTEFKPGQQEIVDSILSKHDTVAILPTGGGKSLCYQLPALMLPGVTLVISPLIALMKDQVDSLGMQGISSSYINSSLNAAQVKERLYQACRGKYRLLYVAPERLQSEQFDNIMRELPLSLIAIDEAHCVSQWGHDFRPSFLSIGSWVASLKQRPLLAAFTATATTRVREDIINGLGLQQPRIYINSFDRPNLRFSVEKSGGRSRFIREYLQSHPGQAGIIYAATRKEADSLYQELSARGLSVSKYHAGMSNGERNTAQEDFIHDRVQAIVATNAFGLGIDKSNARFVIHHNMPRHLEAYYQEAGRAGRDGEAADCILLYQPADIQVQKYLIEQSVLSPERKGIEYGKLQSMIDYCHTSACLRTYILNYFGETPLTDNCTNCTNCLEYELRDMTVEAQKVLSCVYRMRQQYGISLVAAVLAGSKQKRVLQSGFDRLSTYGIMSDWQTRQIVEFINLLIAEGYLSSSGGKYPVVMLTPAANPVLRGQEKLMIRMIPKPAIDIDTDNDVFEALRALRYTIAQQEQVPPYVVFADSTLREMASFMPRNPEALLQITGVGELKLKKYGQRFIEVICRYIPDDDIEDLPGKTEARPSNAVNSKKGRSIPSRNPKIPTHVISWQMYSEGKSLKEIARERDLTVNTIQSHLVRAAMAGYAMKWEQFISNPQEELILQTVGETGTERLAPVKEALPEDIDYFMIRLALIKNGLLR
ncbi:MAG: DNA helicase RecQ [Syntrophomonadaceae bacterium]|jgi:ATP-dependent DNA helicase RecQ